MRILYVTTVGGTMSFFTTLIEKLLVDGHTVDIATNEQSGKTPVPSCYRQWGCRIYQLSCTRSPFNRGTSAGVREIRGIVDQGNYDIVHCHTPVAAACTRLACRKLRRRGLRVFYTAHGFHFYDGAPIKNWLLYYPVEKICARWTDVLVTINKEDFERAQRKFKVCKVVYVPGVGVDEVAFRQVELSLDERKAKRAMLGVADDDYLMLSVGELNSNKNHSAVIRAMSEVKLDKLYYAIAGKGPLEDTLRQLAEAKRVADRVFLLGYRDDVAELLAISDLFVFPSRREGLPVAVMEALASGIDVLCARNRGAVDLVREDGLYEPDNIQLLASRITSKYTSRLQQANNRNSRLDKRFSQSNVIGEMVSLYEGLDEDEQLGF